MAFHAPNLFVAGSANGSIAVYNLDSHQLKAVLATGTKARVEKVFLVTRDVAQKAHHVTGGYASTDAAVHMGVHGKVEDALIMISFQVDGQIQFWQPRVAELLFEIDAKLPRYDERIESADVVEEQGVLAIGSSYGGIKLWAYKPALPNRSAHAALLISSFKGSDGAISYLQLIIERSQLIAAVPDGTIALFTLCGIKLGIFGQLQSFTAAVSEARASARDLAELTAAALSANAKAALDPAVEAPMPTVLLSAAEPDAAERRRSSVAQGAVTVQETSSSVFLTDVDLGQDTPLQTNEIPMATRHGIPRSHPNIRSRSVMGGFYGGRASVDDSVVQPPRPASLPEFGITDVQLPVLASTASATHPKLNDPRALKMDVDRVLSLGPSIRERLQTGVEFSVAHRLPLKLPAIVRTPRALAAKAAMVRRKELWSKLKAALRNKCALLQLRLMPLLGGVCAAGDARAGQQVSTTVVFTHVAILPLEIVCCVCMRAYAFWAEPCGCRV